MKIRLARLWPLGLALAGLVMLGIGAARVLRQEPVDEDEYVEAEPDEDLLAAGERFEVVRRHEMQEMAGYEGKALAGSPIEVRAPRGMRVPVVEIVKEQGEFVEKGDALMRFDRPQIERAIVKARELGREADAVRFEGYLEFETIRAPVDGQVLEIFQMEGHTPIDDGIPLLTLTDRSTWSFLALVPDDVVNAHAGLGAKIEVVLEDDLGRPKGVVSGFDKTLDGPLVPAGGYRYVVAALEPHEGLEGGLRGQLMLPSVRRAVALVPRSAVTWSGDVAVVRVFEDGEILERTVKSGGELLDDLIIDYGVVPGETVVVPSGSR